MREREMLIRLIAGSVALIIVVCICCMFMGCGNQTLLDTTWTFERAIIFLPDGEKIEGKVSSWTDYDDSDMIQVTIDGKTYLTHWNYAILISE